MGAGSRSANTGMIMKRSASTPPGKFGRGAIPGYTGHVPGRNSEDIHACTWAEANRTACERVGKRGQPVIPKDAHWRVYRSYSDRHLDGTVDGGSLNSTIGSCGEPGPLLPVYSSFHNFGGTRRQRAGAGIPGYAGHIPGKYAGNVFGSRFAESNLGALEVRRQQGATWPPNPAHWPPLSMSADHQPAWHRRIVAEAHADGRRTRAHEVGRQQHDADLSLRVFDRTHSHQVRDAIDTGGWRLWEPRTVHETLRYGQNIRPSTIPNILAAC